MNLDSILNVIFFIVGLAIGLLQLYIGQHQFEVQQREKMDELRKILTDIQQRLAILEETTTQRAFEVQDKLISLVAGEEAVAEFTEETVKKVQELVSDEFQKAGIQESINRTNMLEARLTKVLEQSASSLVDSASREVSPLLTIRENQVLELLNQGLTYRDIANKLAIPEPSVKYRVRNMMDKFNVGSRAELIEFYQKMVGSFPLPSRPE